MVARQPFCAAIVAPADLRLQNVKNFATGTGNVYAAPCDVDTNHINLSPRDLRKTRDRIDEVLESADIA